MPDGQTFLDEYLSLVNETIEKAENLRNLLVELKLSGNYDDNMLYDGITELDEACRNMTQYSYIGGGTRIKRLLS